ncbi:MAG: transaldolase [Chloroflexi bacterium RBG_16_47_49]|nr:MAG: transaldolase [Chloroflexi bacterium RBG_16_47_49]
MSSKISQLTDLGQSLWYDYMERRILENGDLARMINQGDIRGLTSNPSIFNLAIAKSKDYDSALIPMAWAGYSDKTILEQLMIEDIGRVADLLRPLFDRTHGGDGFVSLEVRPDLAYDTEKTIAEAQRLWDIVKRPNVMIKIPATKPGLLAIRQSITAGININITLIFSINRYLEVMEAYLSGLEDRVKEGKPIDQINSVASFFVSRIDSKVEKYLQPIIQAAGRDAQKAKSLLGKIAIANARLAYQEFQKVFQSERFTRLQSKGAKLQRPLWASTSTKSPAYPDTMYVDELIGAHTVNTVPPQTLVAFRDHGKVQQTIDKDLDAAKKDFSDLETVGISMQKVTQELEEEGVQAFSVSYDSLLASVKERRENALLELGPLANSISIRVSNLQVDNFSKRFYSKDASLWTSDPVGKEEVRNRMGWLGLPSSSRALLPGLKKLVSEVQQAGYTHALLLGMGGSSLAAEVISLIFGDAISGLKLTILDSTDPAQVLRAAQKNPISKTLFIVSSKSGGTAEINAMFNYFWDRAHHSVGVEASDHFIAITDPGTSLEKMAFERNFRKIFLADPNVGGRYSALTAFGLVPAALMGIDVEGFLNCASWMALECGPDQPLGRNTGIVLGVVLGEAFCQGRDKLTLIADPEVAPFGAWLEQLIAESSGKQGKGIVPIHGEPPATPDLYGNDRLFIYLRRSAKFDEKVKLLRKAGQPVLTQDIEENLTSAAEFYKWEIAIATACSIIGVNPFDQPDVQDSKNRTVAKISHYQTHHEYPESKPVLVEDGIYLYGKNFVDGMDLPYQVGKFIESGEPGDYVAINAYLSRNKKVEASLQKLRTWIRSKTKLATTVGFGPRFLHSTGQLHKGGANNGLFLVITSDPVQDVEIPQQNLSFGTLEHGQALGDLEALEAQYRRVLHIHLAKPELLNIFIEKLSLD